MWIQFEPPARHVYLHQNNDWIWWRRSFDLTNEIKKIHLIVNWDKKRKLNSFLRRNLDQSSRGQALNKKGVFGRQKKAKSKQVLKNWIFLFSTITNRLYWRTRMRKITQRISSYKNVHFFITESIQNLLNPDFSTSAFRS